MLRWVVLVVMGLGVSLQEGVASDGLVEVWNFDRGLRNELGGGYNGLSRNPSDVVPRLLAREYRGEAGRSLRMDYLSRNDRCGVWMHLYPTGSTPDSGSLVQSDVFPYLSFWVKGAKGGERFDIRLADHRLSLQENTVRVGSVDDFLANGVTTEWQEVVVPLSDVHLSSPGVAVLAFFFPEGSEGRVYIEDVYFKREKPLPVPLTRKDDIWSGKERPLRRAMWVWKIHPLLDDQQVRNELIAFSAKHNIDELYMQITSAYTINPLGEVSGKISKAEAWRTLLQDLSRHKISVFALEGAPDYALRAYHDHLVALTDAVIEFNHYAPEGATFKGIRFDNEPYLLSDFEGDRRREIFLEWLEGNTRVADRIAERESDLVFGVDIPFWLDSMDLGEGPEILFNQQLKAVSSHLLDIVDEITLMDYRDVAGGEDGIIAHGSGEVAYGSKVGKPVLLGVETFSYIPSPVRFVGHLSHEEYRNAVSGGGVLEDRYEFEGFRVQTLPSADGKFVGLQELNRVGTHHSTDFQSALNLFRQQLSLTNGQWLTEKRMKQAQKNIRRNPEYEGWAQRPVRTEGGQGADGFESVKFMLDKVTFAQESKAELELAFEEVAGSLRESPGFAGFAIHYYDSYKRLADR